MSSRTDGSDVIPTQKLAAEVLAVVESSSLSAKSALREYFEDVDIDYRVRGSVHAYVFEVLKRRNFIDFILEKALGFRNLKSINPFLINLLKIGIYEMYFKSVPPPLATDSAVRIAKEVSPRAASFVNAILRNAENVDVDEELEKIKKRSRRKYIALKYFHPEWYVRIAEKITSDYEKLLMSNLSQTAYIRVNTLLSSEEKAVRRLERQEVVLEETPLPEVFRVVSYVKPLTILDGYDRDFVIQDLASCLVSIAVNPEPADVIVDLASAPGSKTSHLAALMENRGRIIAVDSSKERIERMKARLKRLGVRNVECTVYDGTKFRYLAEKVLLDAPCSSTGSVRSHPSIKWRYSPKKLQALLKLQRNMLRNSAKIADEVIYSTCSITFEENEENLMKLNGIFEVKKLNLPVGMPGIRKYGRKVFDRAERVVRLYPHIHNTSGFFISRLSVKS